MPVPQFFSATKIAVATTASALSWSAQNRIVKAGGERQMEMMRSGSGYLSSSELVLTFGLGKSGQADEIELRWPSGQIDKLSKVAAGQTITLKEGAGIVQQRPFGAAPSAPAKAVAAGKTPGR